MPVLGTIETSFKIDRESASYLGWAMGAAFVGGGILLGVVLFFAFRAFK